jgi:hypothetical protein
MFMLHVFYFDDRYGNLILLRMRALACCMLVEVHDERNDVRMASQPRKFGAKERMPGVGTPTPTRTDTLRKDFKDVKI